MRDIVLILFFGLVLLMGLKRPFLWVLLYLYVDVVLPQKVGWGFITAIPLSQVAFIAAFGGFLLLDSKEGSRFTLRQGLILALLALCFVTTLTADFPDTAWDKWDWVWKSLIFAIFLPLTLRTRSRIEAAMLFYVLSLAAIVINGGLKTIFGGGGYDTLSMLVPENAGIYESSTISAAAISSIPFILFLARRGTFFKPSLPVWLFAAGLVFASLLIPIGTAARTGLVCTGVLAVLMMRSVRHRVLYAGFAGLLLVASIPFLPDSFTERMGTISGYQSDESASSRLAVWAWTFDYAKSNPLGGGFDAYRSNSFTYDMPEVTGTGNNVQVTYHQVTDEARAYHSAYFEILGEQGFLGLFLFLWLHLLGVWHMERIRRRESDRHDDRDEWMFDLATALQHGQVIFLVGAMFVGIAYQPFIFIIIAMQCALWSYWSRLRQVAKPSFLPAGPAQAEPSRAA